MKIGIIGNYGATNVGDDAILTAILKNLSGNEVVIFSSNPTKTRVQYGGIPSAPLFPFGIRSFFKYGFRQSIKAIKEVDVVMLGGGGLFQDNYLYACFIWAWQIFWVKMLNKPLFIYGVGVGPLFSWIGKKITKWAFGKADFVSVRDQYSYDLLKDIGVKRADEIEICSDPAFQFQKPETQKERTKNLFMISIRPWLNYDDESTKIFINALKDIKEERDAQFIFVSMQQIKEQDQKILNKIISKIGGELYIPNNFSELIQRLLTVEFAIGMRYHFLIAAMITQTPVIPISYSPKVEELFRDTPLDPYLIPIHDLSTDMLKNGIKRVSVDYNNVKVYQKARTTALFELSQINVDLFTGFIKRFDQK